MLEHAKDIDAVNTPGPWFAEPHEDGNADEFSIRSESSGEYVCTVVGYRDAIRVAAGPTLLEIVRDLAADPTPEELHDLIARAQGFMRENAALREVQRG